MDLWITASQFVRRSLYELGGSWLAGLGVTADWQYGDP